MVNRSRILLSEFKFSSDSVDSSIPVSSTFRRAFVDFVDKIAYLHLVSPTVY